MQEYDMNTSFILPLKPVDHSFGNSIEFTKSNVLELILYWAGKYYGKIQNLSIFQQMKYTEKSQKSSIEKSILNPTNPYAATRPEQNSLSNRLGNRLIFRISS